MLQTDEFENVKQILLEVSFFIGLNVVIGSLYIYIFFLVFVWRSAKGSSIERH